MKRILSVVFGIGLSLSSVFAQDTGSLFFAKPALWRPVVPTSAEQMSFTTDFVAQNFQRSGNVLGCYFSGNKVNDLMYVDKGIRLRFIGFAANDLTAFFKLSSNKIYSLNCYLAQASGQVVQMKPNQRMLKVAFRNYGEIDYQLWAKMEEIKP